MFHYICFIWIYYCLSRLVCVCVFSFSYIYTVLVYIDIKWKVAIIVSATLWPPTQLPTRTRFCIVKQRFTFLKRLILHDAIRKCICLLINRINCQKSVKFHISFKRIFSWFWFKSHHQRATHCYYLCWRGDKFKELPEM